MPDPSSPRTASSNNVFTKGFIPGLIVGLLVGLGVGVYLPAMLGPSTIIKPDPNAPKRTGPSERDPFPPESTPADPAKPDADKPASPTTPGTSTETPKPRS